MQITHSAPDSRDDRTEAEARRPGRPTARLVLTLALVATLLILGDRAWSRPAVQSNAVEGEVGACEGQDTSAYENGRIPPEALCPAGWTDRGDEVRLRADAAQALLTLAASWQAEHASHLCVRSAYRSFEQQAELFARMPELAAPPGVSSHGWGTAVDLCGGIADASSPQHSWMVQHGPEHGWIQPDWARQGGSRPEPWHWEYVHGPRTFTG